MHSTSQSQFGRDYSCRRRCYIGADPGTAGAWLSLVACIRLPHARRFRFVHGNGVEQRTSDVLKHEFKVSDFSGYCLSGLYSSALTQGWRQVRAIHEGEHPARAGLSEDFCATLLEVAHWNTESVNYLLASVKEGAIRRAVLTAGSREQVRASPRS